MYVTIYRVDARRQAARVQNAHEQEPADLPSHLIALPVAWVPGGASRRRPHADDMVTLWRDGATLCALAPLMDPRAEVR